MSVENEQGDAIRDGTSLTRETKSSGANRDRETREGLTGGRPPVYFPVLFGSEIRSPSTAPSQTKSSPKTRLSKDLP